MYSLTRKQKLRLIDHEIRIVEKLLRPEHDFYVVPNKPDQAADDYRKMFFKSLHEHYDSLMSERNRIQQDHNNGNTKGVHLETYACLKNIAYLTGTLFTVSDELIGMLERFDVQYLADLYNFMVYVDKVMRCLRLIGHYRQIINNQSWKFNFNFDLNYREEFLRLLYEVTQDSPWSTRRINKCLHPGVV